MKMMCTRCMCVLAHVVAAWTLYCARIRVIQLFDWRSHPPSIENVSLIIRAITECKTLSLLLLWRSSAGLTLIHSSSNSVFQSSIKFYRYCIWASLWTRHWLISGSIKLDRTLYFGRPATVFIIVTSSLDRCGAEDFFALTTHRFRGEGHSSYKWNVQFAVTCLFQTITLHDGVYKRSVPLYGK
jgi:hypothetical protein